MTINDESRARHIILIMTDTQRKDMLGCYGNGDLQTPNLDALARSGVRFERAYCCQPVCGPARSALFTGTFPHTNGSWGNSMSLSQKTRSVGQRLQAHGYQAAYIGKWHLDGGDYFGDGLCPPGWDPAYWYDMRCYLEELSEDDRRASREPKTIFEKPVAEDFTFAHRVSNRAIDFIGKHQTRDFFLVVSYDEPHYPFLCPPDYVRRYENYEFPKSKNVWDTLENKPEHQRIWAGERRNADREAVKIKNAFYFGCNDFVDYQIGRVLAAIERYLPEALVIYTSDHGDMLESHCLDSKGPAMYEEMTNIPFIVRWPSRCPAGAVSPSLVSHIDVVPTILDAAGLEIPAPLAGKTLLPLLDDPHSQVREEVFIEFHRFEIILDGFGGFQPIRCIRDERYKLVINLLTSDELYDLAEDPDEMENLIEVETYAAIRNALHDRLLAWMDETRDPFRGYYWQTRSWRRDAPRPTWRSGSARYKPQDVGERRQLNYLTGVEIENLVRRD